MVGARKQQEWGQGAASSALEVAWLASVVGMVGHDSGYSRCSQLRAACHTHLCMMMSFLKPLSLPLAVWP